jgi:hypothetical protein
VSLKKDKYEELKDILNDYMRHMDRINQKRLVASEREVQFIMQEGKLFTMLLGNIQKLEEKHGISQD